MKTGDPQGPWVRIPPSPPFTTESPFTNFALEKYSRGRRGAPAKGVGRETGARVQIPPSPPEIAPHESAGLFTLFVGIWTRAPKGAGKKSDRRLWRIQGGFFGAAVGKAEAAAPADGRAAHRKRACEAGSNPPFSARKSPGNKPFPGLFALPAGIWTRAPEGAGKKSDRRQWRIQGGFFGAAVGKAEAAAPADGRAAHRKRACEADSNPTAAARGLVCCAYFFKFTSLFSTE